VACDCHTAIAPAGRRVRQLLRWPANDVSEAIPCERPASDRARRPSFSDPVTTFIRLQGRFRRRFTNGEKGVDTPDILLSREPPRELCRHRRHPFATLTVLSRSGGSARVGTRTGRESIPLISMSAVRRMRATTAAGHGQPRPPFRPRPALKAGHLRVRGCKSLSTNLRPGASHALARITATRRQRCVVGNSKKNREEAAVERTARRPRCGSGV